LVFLALFENHKLTLECNIIKNQHPKIFTGAQKAKVALEAVKGVKTINEIAQEHGVHPTQVSQWKKELMDNAGSLFEGKRGPKPINAQSDPDRLYAKIGQLNMELDWLKKKSGISQ
jgi:transposase-like protein